MQMRDVNRRVQLHDGLRRRIWPSSDFHNGDGQQERRDAHFVPGDPEHDIDHADGNIPRAITFRLFSMSKENLMISPSSNSSPMQRPQRKLVRERRGAMLVFIAVAGIVLMGFLAMTLDIGAGSRQRRIAQTAADAGAIGGGQEIYRLNGSAAV